MELETRPGSLLRAVPQVFFPNVEKVSHLLFGFLASDGWTLGSSALGEGSSKDARCGFTPHWTRTFLKLYRSPETR